MTLSHASFRSGFPALERTVWLDTPGSPPGAAPVVAAMRRALDEWLSGGFDWQDWHARAESTRGMIAELAGLPDWRVATVSSTAEGVATVAQAHRRGEVLALEDEFQSSLLPWTSRADADLRVRLAPRRSESRTEDLLAALTERTTLVSVSHVHTGSGRPVDLFALRRSCDEVGARLLVNVTQALGALRLRLAEVRPDFVVVHGYKWLLAPRGIAWLLVRPDRGEELRPPSPGWAANPAQRGNFGDPFGTQFDIASANGSPSWFAALGAVPALALMLQLDPAIVDAHVRGLGRRFGEGLRELGAEDLSGGESHIVVSRLPSHEAVRRVFGGRGIRALVTPERFRVGFHFYNSEEDVDFALDALAEALGR